MITMTSNHPRGCHGARRLFVMAAVILTGATSVVSLNATDGPDPQQTVTVREEGGVYSVAARFHVPQTPAIAMAVLTDYEHIPAFMPGVITSTVIERAPGTVVVEQEATSRVMMFSKRVQLVLEITEGTDTLRFRDRSNRSFARYEGVWRMCEDHGGAEIVYELTAQPSFEVPNFLLKRLLKRDSGQMIEGLRREISVRSSKRRGDA